MGPPGQGGPQLRRPSPKLRVPAGRPCLKAVAPYPGPLLGLLPTTIMQHLRVYFDGLLKADVHGTLPMRPHTMAHLSPVRFGSSTKS